MLITIIAIVVFAICIGLTIYGYFQNDDLNFIFGIGSAISGIILLVIAITLIAPNTTIGKQMHEIWYQQKVEELQSTYDTLITYQDNEIARVSITEYNEEVKEFKVDILTNQQCLNNLWINWFICPAYKNFDANIVSYIK